MEILKLEEEAPINTYKERKNKRKAFIENIFDSIYKSPKKEKKY